MQVAIAVDDSVGTSVWGAVPALAIRVTGQLSDVALSWQLHVSSANPEQAAGLISRRRAFSATGLALIVVIVAAAVARLQADFISAVSHEFPTPLTPMNHLTEMLHQEGAVPAGR